MNMSKSHPLRRQGTFAILRHGLAVLFVTAALLLTQLMRSSIDVTPLFFAAVMSSTWFGGMGPGLLSVLLATLAIDYYFVPPLYSLDMSTKDVTHLIVFGLLALFISGLSSARRRAENSLRQARDELEVRVQERTRDLQQTNESLQAEIIERRRVEEILREQANLLDLTHDTILVRDMHNQITYWNHGAEEMYGFAKEEAIGKVSHLLFQTRFPIPLKEIEAELIRAGRWEGELIHVRRDGMQITTASRWALQRDEQGRPVAVLEINTNITERKQAEYALQKTQADLAHAARVMTMGALTTSIAHEVNQPLGAIVANGNACLRWLAGETPNLEEARQALERIIRDGNRASQVIERIRALLKKTSPDKTRLDINDLIDEVVALTRNEVQRNQVLLQTELAAELPSVIGDRVQLQQVILNLIMNAVEAMSMVTDRSRHLLIRSQKQDSTGVVVAVQDSGIGIDPQSRERIFDAFFTTKPKGMGMGLSISRSIIGAHGGQLWATSNAGPGATFQFTLPAAAENAS
jgi:two-component system, LuxR family, sensor kinase FixL